MDPAKHSETEEGRRPRQPGVMAEKERKKGSKVPWKVQSDVTFEEMQLDDEAQADFGISHRMWGQGFQPPCATHSPNSSPCDAPDNANATASGDNHVRTGSGEASDSTELPVSTAQSDSGQQEQEVRSDESCDSQLEEATGSAPR